MDLYASILRRKSCRKYDMQPLSSEKLAEIDRAIGSFKPLYPDVPLKWRFVSRVKGLYHINAPHYLVISGEGRPGEKENAGFLFEQLVLWFDGMELGCVWLGESKDAGAGRTKNDIVTIAFGGVTEPVHRTKEQFKRKPIQDITNAMEDICVQAAHLAPSGMNTQPWYFEKHQNKVLLYKQKLKPPVSLIYKHSDIDMGIGLCHYYLACEEVGKPFRFSRESKLPDKAGFLPFGIITC